MLRTMLHDQKTGDKLGEDGLAAVAGSLFARDCQTCGQPLGNDAPALCIDDHSEFAVASLHHPRCRPPCWNDDPVMIVRAGPGASWAAVAFMAPATSGGEDGPRATMLLNPALEMTFLEPQPGTWRPAYNRLFPTLGLVPPGPGVMFDSPLAGVSAWLADDGISVAVGSPPEVVFQAGAPRDVVARAHEQQGLLLMVTQALDPAELTEVPVRQLMQSGQVICGWVTAAQG